MVALRITQQTGQTILDMFPRYRLPFFEQLFTLGFLLRHSIELYSDHTGVLGAVNGFFLNALKLAGFF